MYLFSFRISLYFIVFEKAHSFIILFYFFEYYKKRNEIQLNSNTT